VHAAADLLPGGDQEAGFFFDFADSGVSGGFARLDLAGGAPT
jgi:hypothetical protein